MRVRELDLSSKSCQESKGTVTLVVDPVGAFEKVQSSVAWHWTTCFRCPQRVSKVLCGYFAHERRVMFHLGTPMITVTSTLQNPTGSFARDFSKNSELRIPVYEVRLEMNFHEID